VFYLIRHARGFPYLSASLNVLQLGFMIIITAAYINATLFQSDLAIDATVGKVVRPILSTCVALIALLPTVVAALVKTGCGWYGWIARALGQHQENFELAPVPLKSNKVIEPLGSIRPAVKAVEMATMSWVDGRQPRSKSEIDQSELLPPSMEVCRTQSE
jgi:hypothetical protein